MTCFKNFAPLIKSISPYPYTLKKFSSLLYLPIFIVSPLITITNTSTGMVGESYSVASVVDADNNISNIVITATIVKIR